jgi:hypothetical protein
MMESYAVDLHLLYKYQGFTLPPWKFGKRQLVITTNIALSFILSNNYQQSFTIYESMIIGWSFILKCFSVKFEIHDGPTSRMLQYFFFCGNL